MAKFYVAVSTNNKTYKLARQDISKVHSLKRRTLPTLPHFNAFQKQKHIDAPTDSDDNDLQFEPIQFFINPSYSHS